MKTQTHHSTTQTQNRTRAFTLVELMLVVTIIGILAALVVPGLMTRSEQSRLAAANADVMGGISTALNLYEVDNGVFPKSLQDLFQEPADARNWHGPYLKKLPVDPWGNPYLYYYPGKHNPSSFDLLSVGRDGKEGTDDDIGNWQ
jgi:general secretion pathway protein G